MMWIFIFKRYLLLFFLFFFISVVYGQGFSLKPNSLNIDNYTHGMWEFNEGITSQKLNEYRIRGQLNTRSGISLFIENKSRFQTDLPSENKLSQYYLQYSKAFSHESWFPLFKYNTRVLLKAGKIEWYPTFRDTRLIKENLDLFRDPYSFHGILLDLNMPLLKDYSLRARITGHSHDFAQKDTKAQIRNAYVNYRYNFIKNFGLRTQMGLMEGNRHLVNYAYLFYGHKFDNVQLGLKAGKLLSLDDIPYGIEVSLEREFNYVAFGGFYQIRLGQQDYFEKNKTDSQIFGFSMRILGPKVLRDVMDTYQLLYDTNTKTLRFVIPVLLTNFDFK